MKIFISWSGDRSRYIANTLRDWLPQMLQAVAPFISTQDIKKGTKGLVTIAKELEESSVGIICLTPENLNMPWILFEAGALSKSSAAYVCTFLFQVESANIRPPLGEFQFTKNDREDIKQLCSTINVLLGDRQLDHERFEKAFEVWYPHLQDKLNAVPAPEADAPPVDTRSPDDKLDELLRLVRNSNAERPIVNENLPAAPTEIAKFLLWLRDNDPECIANEKLCKTLKGYHHALRKELVDISYGNGGERYVRLTEMGRMYIRNLSRHGFNVSTHALKLDI